MKATKYVFATAVGLALFGTAHAEDWKVTGQFGYFGVGKATELEKGHLYWVGEFAGVFFNDKGKESPFDHAGVKCPAFNDLDLNKKKGKAAGYCIISDGAGDEAYLTWNCEGDTVTCSGPFQYTGGTGKYQNVSGANTFTAMTAVQWKDGTVSGSATWNR